MKQLRKAILLFVMLASFTITPFLKANAQIPDDVVLSLKSGNAKVLAGYFNQNIELAILDDDNVYSKAQAEQRGKEGAQYVIGNLVTKQETFRVYFLLKTSGDKVIIHQLKIEKQI